MKPAKGAKQDAFQWNATALGQLAPEQRQRVIRLLATLLHRRVSMDLCKNKAA